MNKFSISLYQMIYSNWMQNCTVFTGLDENAVATPTSTTALPNFPSKESPNPCHKKHEKISRIKEKQKLPCLSSYALLLLDWILVGYIAFLFPNPSRLNID
jgi:hypothetical protein